LQRERSRGTTLERITDGINYMRRRPFSGAISLDLFAMFLGGTTALLPDLCRDILHTGPAGLGFLRTAPSMGAALVRSRLARWQLHRHTGKSNVRLCRAVRRGHIVFGLSPILLSLAALPLAVRPTW